MGTSKRRNWVREPTSVLVNFDDARASRDRQAATAPKRRKRKNTKWDFYKTASWLRLRYRVLKRFGGRCQCCGRGAKEGVVLNVDHIKPRSRYPELELKISNMQVLCSECNQGKGWRDETDWR